MLACALEELIGTRPGFDDELYRELPEDERPVHPTISKLEELYSEGKLNAVKERLCKYVCAHKDEIVQYIKSKVQDSLDDAPYYILFSQYLIEKKSIDFFAECCEQVNEIKEHIYRMREKLGQHRPNGVSCFLHHCLPNADLEKTNKIENPQSLDEKEIVPLLEQEWVYYYAPVYRDHLISSMVYIVYKEKDHFEKLLTT